VRIAFKTFGCKANSVDTDSLYFEARRRGLEVVPEDQVADAYVINSCTVTSAADRDARYQALRYKRLNPSALIGVVGCYAQVAKEELLGETHIDFVVGTAEKQRILDCFLDSWKSVEVARDQVLPADGFLTRDFPGSRNARPSIKVQDGCNFACSFCIIPKARGRSRSLPVETVLKQIDEAGAQGFQEVTLTGIHLAHYGWDLGTDLMKLLGEIFKKPAGPRIRVSTLDPFEIPDSLIEMLGKEPRLCPHFHIALQSGSDRVLEGMRRIYKAEEFVTVTNKIGARHPDTFIGVDVIVGFPGEDEAAFQETVDCLERSFWTKLHVFPFSVRKDTRAEKMTGKVRDSDITRRSAVLRQMSDRRTRAFLERHVGRECDVLVEKATAKFPGLWLGHTENYLPTLSRAPLRQSREILRSRITGLQGERLLTEPV
jgi:threonylcarbamoyladenosine tRNA methylthiotransferase MtaB